MADEKWQLTIAEQFENNTIRKIWHEGEWWYSLVDVMSVFAGTNRARKYWYDLKKKIVEEEGYGELSEKIGQLKLEAPDGKQRLTDIANFNTISRVLQSVASPKAESFKQWLASLATEEVQAIDDPELAKERLRKAYERMNRPASWIKLRLDGIDIRKKLTNEWQVRGIVAGWEYAVLTNRISEETFGITTGDHKDLKGLKRQDLREHYTEIEHALINLSEAASHEFTVQRDSQGFECIQQDAIDGGRVGGRARTDLESQGLKVVSEQNYLEKPKRKQLEREEQCQVEQPQSSLFPEFEVRQDEK
jgi:DNA-damage-inducible protein D